jgi:threonine dehydratase
MPEAVNLVKIAATKSLGTEVIQTSCDFDVMRVATEEFANHHNMRFIY